MGFIFEYLFSSSADFLIVIILLLSSIVLIVLLKTTSSVLAFPNCAICAYVVDEVGYGDVDDSDCSEDSDKRFLLYKWRRRVVWFVCTFLLLPVTLEPKSDRYWNLRTVELVFGTCLCLFWPLGSNRINLSFMSLWMRLDAKEKGFRVWSW